jgi:hypothetical protein
MAVIKIRPYDQFSSLLRPSSLRNPSSPCVITIWAPASAGSSRTHSRGVPHTDTEAPSPSFCLLQFCTCLYMTSSPEPLLPEIRRVLVQTPLPFRSMTAVRCGRGCTFVAPLIQYTLVSKCQAMSDVSLCDPISAFTTLY